MALIEFGVTECPLCSEPISEGDEIVATSHFIDDEADPLWAFSDAAIHRVCFLNWPERETFVARFNEAFRAVLFGDGTYQQMDSHGCVSFHRP